MSDCIESHRKPDRSGYVKRKRRSRTVLQHRWAYAEHHDLDYWGDEMKGLEVDHLCFNRACMNVDHLELVTPQENIRRLHSAGRHRSERGEQRWSAKLSESDVRNIRDHHRLHGLTQRSLAALYGVTQPHISGIITGRFWSHVS